MLAPCGGQAQAWLQVSASHPSWSPMVRQALGHCALISSLELEFSQQPLWQLLQSRHQKGP